MRIYTGFLLAFLYSFSANGAFFNIDQQEKHLMITCAFDLFLKKIGKKGNQEEMDSEYEEDPQEEPESSPENSFDCSHVTNTVTKGLYNRFINEIRNSYDPHKSDLDWKEKLPEVYQTFESFKQNIQTVCENGETACKQIQGGTYHRSRFQRKTCNSLCSQRTCRDPFTLSVCFAMSENQINDQDICPPDTVKNCLRANSSNLESLLANRGWPTGWANLEESWEHIFLATASDVAKGKSVGFRLLEIGGGTLALGGAIAAMAALPMIIAALAPVAPGAVKYVKGQAINLLRSQASNLANKGLNIAKNTAQQQGEKISNYAKNERPKLQDDWKSFEGDIGGYGY